MTPHYDDTGHCQCRCGCCAPVGCPPRESDGACGGRGCDNYRADGTPKRITITDKRAAR